jgi:hypothetical protein
MGLVQVARLESRMAAQIVRGRLEWEGVPAMLFDDGLASLGIGSITPVRLMVDEEDEVLARELLASF